LARHPWEITLREFVEVVRRNYGIEIELVSAAIISGWFLTGNGEVHALPGIDSDDVMPPELLRHLCFFFHVPPADFHLDPEGD
jgi:hypothetical protein